MPFPFAAAAPLISTGIDLFSQLFGGNQGDDTRRGYEDMQRMIQQGMQARKDYTGQGIDARKNYTGQANNMIMPWQQAGQREMPGYQQNYQRMMSPDFIKGIMGEYQQSPYATMQLAKGQGAINNAASASGMLGSTDFGRDQADYARQITSADQNQYLQNRLGAYNQGLGHQGGMVGQGLGAGSQMSGNLMNLGHAIAGDYGRLGDNLAGDYGQMGQAIQGQRYGEGQGRDEFMRSIGNAGRSIFDYLGGGGDSSNDAPGRAKLPTPQFRRYG